MELGGIKVWDDEGGGGYLFVLRAILISGILLHNWGDSTLKSSFHVVPTGGFYKMEFVFICGCLNLWS